VSHQEIVYLLQNADVVNDVITYVILVIVYVTGIIIFTRTEMKTFSGEVAMK